jgi:hypothetical protein
MRSIISARWAISSACLSAMRRMVDHENSCTSSSCCLLTGQILPTWLDYTQYRGEEQWQNGHNVHRASNIFICQREYGLWLQHFFQNA